MRNDNERWDPPSPVAFASKGVVLEAALLPVQHWVSGSSVLGRYKDSLVSWPDVAKLRTMPWFCAATVFCLSVRSISHRVTLRPRALRCPTCQTRLTWLMFLAPTRLRVCVEVQSWILRVHPNRLRGVFLAWRWLFTGLVSQNAFACTFPGHR